MIKRYYWCVNCGHHGDFKRPKKRSIECQECSYKDIIALDKDEFEEKMIEIMNLEMKHEFKD